MFDLVYVITALVIVFISIILHEIAHGYVSYLLGDDTAKVSGRLTLNPISHIDPFMTIILPMMLAAVGAPVFGGAKPVPIDPSRFRYRFNEWGLLLVAIAGPLTNLAIAFVSFGIMVFAGSTLGDFGPILSYVVSINLSLFVFNMLPLPPLDGSRILYTLAPDFVREIMESIESYGVLLVFFIVTIGNDYIGNIILSISRMILAVFSGIFGV